MGVKGKFYKLHDGVDGGFAVKKVHQYASQNFMAACTFNFSTSSVQVKVIDEVSGENNNLSEI